MRAIRPAIAASVSVAAMLLAACGGGGGSSTDDPGTDPPAGVGTGEGVFGGSFYNDATQDQDSHVMAMLPDRSYWSLYGKRVAADGSLMLSGFMQGTGAPDAANTKFVSEDALNVNGRDPVTPVSVSASFYADGTEVRGNINRFNGGAATFKGTTQGVAPYQYATPATASAAAGSWQTKKLGDESGTATVGADGAFNLITIKGCTATGTVTPSPTGKNIYDVHINMGPVPCTNANTVQSGVGILLPLASGKSQFLIATLDADRMKWAFGTGLR